MDLFNGKARQRAEELNELLQAMANGNLDQQIMQSSDPVWSGVYRQLALVQQRMRQLQQEVAQNESLEQGLMEMTRKHQDGWIDEVIPSQKLSGTHARIADGINALVAAHIAVKMQVVKVVSAYSQGDFSQHMERLPGKKAQITEAIDAVGERLKQADRALESSMRIKSALDNVTANVMIADRDFNIIYTNRAVMDMFSAAESDIRSELPQFRTSEILGGSIDRFHKNPAHQRGMLERLSSTYRAQIKLGGRTLTVVANPVMSDKGERLGAVVEWQDITVELAAEEKAAKLAAENARVRSALDNCSTNVMIADADRNIIYMNKTVTAMLQNAEADLRKALPNFTVSKLIGSSIDGFHKNPEHQKRLLATFTSTYRTQIEVGGRTFALVANPVMSDSGERLGSVVEWNDRTLEVDVEREVASLVSAAAAGDFSQRIEESSKSGFFLNLASGLNQLMSTADQGLRDVARVLGALAEGDLTQRITADYQGTFGQLKDFSNETAGSLSRMLGQIREAADTIYTAASEISAGNTDLSSRTEEQASSLEETASSMEELTSTVKLNADNARQANSLAVNASEVAVDGGSVVEQVVRTMSSINESSRKIADIISVIDGIAFQTNILALNAAVEAARAGEQGRGFAVVAGEVRTLAQRSAAAAKEIKTLISDSVDKVENGNALVAQAGKTMSEIVTAIKRVTDIMAEIAAASAEQSTGIEEVNGAVSQMDEMTQQNAALVEEAAASAESLLEQASVLSQSVAVFKFEHSSSPQPARPAARPALPRPAAAANRTERAQPKPLPKPGKSQDDDWEEF
jgi:methyl-accepting chemotaxis protein